MEENLFYLILGWNKNDGKIIEPIIKTGKSYMIICPRSKDIDYLSCYCSDKKREIEDIYNKVWPLFEKGEVTKEHKIIPKMVELCKLTERNIKFRWQMKKMEE